jgi:DNA-binding transcriptional ArsR family regulator
MTLIRKQVTDIETLRAVAHPLRVRLLSALRADGPATATELGRRFDESSGSTSYHLRQLARYGFVVEDERQPSRRERRWRAVHDVTSFRPADFLDDGVGRDAVGAMARLQLRHLVDTVERWHREQPDWPREWVDAAEHSDLRLRLRPDDLAQLSRELFEVVQRWAGRQRPDDDLPSRPVSVHVLAIPTGGAAG